VDGIRETTKLTLLNGNVFTVFGLARLYPTVHRGGSAPTDQLLAQACVKLGAGTSATLTLPLTPYGSELVTVHQRLGVRLVLTIDTPVAGPVKTGGIYLLERPRHR
jgi:hypothetical protein